MCSACKTSLIVPVAYRTHVPSNDFVNVAHILLDVVDGHLKHAKVHVSNW